VFAAYLIITVVTIVANAWAAAADLAQPKWPGRTAEDDPGAPFMNESPKYVVSASLQSGD
jgi:hypothetical protein